MKIFVVLAVLAAAANAQEIGNNAIRDNIDAFSNYIFEQITGYYKANGGSIPVPRHQALHDGYFSDLSQLRRQDNIWIHADPADYNPRGFAVEAVLDQAKVVYNDYRASLISKRKLKYDVNNLNFTMNLAIEVTEAECRVIVQDVKVGKGQIGNEEVSGGLIPGINGILGTLALGSSRVVLEAARANVEKNLKDVLGNGVFDCQSYGPSGLFGHAGVPAPQE